MAQTTLPGERLYIATDETDATTLLPLTNNGGMRWMDVVNDLEAGPDSLLFFEDYVGVIEQLVCASARRFLGSQCSSFTGGIYNLRADLHGDYQQETINKFMERSKSDG